MAIPVRNIYYMLLYAWGLFQEAGRCEVGAFAPETPLPVLLATVLTRLTRQQFQMALAGDYAPQAAPLSSPRGRIDLSAWVRNGGREETLPCVFDVYSEDTLPNRLLKATLLQTGTMAGLPRTLQRDLLETAQALDTVSPLGCPLSSFLFETLPPLPEPTHYPLLMAICRFLVEHQQPEEQGHGLQFLNPDRTRMNAVFERFLLNFYRQEMKDVLAHVSARRLEWQLSSTPAEEAFLPRMLTDIVLQTASRTLILDAKYYQTLFQNHHNTTSERKKLNSAHLYQITSYQREWTRAGHGPADAALLYAQPSTTEAGEDTNKEALALCFHHAGQKLFVNTLALDRPWQEIDQTLRQLVRNWLQTQ